MASDPVAQAYAEALFRIAEVEEAVDDVENELLELQRIFKASSSLRSFLDDLTISADGKLRAMEELLEGKVSPITRHELYTVVAQERYRLLPEIIEAYSGLASSHRGQITAEVITALPLPDEVAEKLKTALSRLVNKQVFLRKTVNESIIGGCIVKIGDKIIDGSIHTRLQDLRASMVKNI